jgi:hypothetical protein
MEFKQNEGTIDRVIRVVIGLAIIGLGYYFKSWWGALGIIPLLTGIIGYCMIYELCGGWSTKK